MSEFFDTTHWARLDHNLFVFILDNHPDSYNRGGQKVKRQIHVDTCDIILICNVEFGKPYVSYVSMTAKFLVTYWSNYKIPKLHLCNDGFHNLEFVVIQTSIA